MKVSFGGSYLLKVPKSRIDEVHQEAFLVNNERKNARFTIERIDNNKLLVLTGDDYDTFNRAVGTFINIIDCSGWRTVIKNAFAEKAVKIDLTNVHWDK